jgi:iron complex transport system ATP-binding protein
LSLTPSRPAILRTDDVSFVRDGCHLLCDVSVAIHAGESWVVLGPNGGGKTTLLSLFGGDRASDHGIFTCARAPSGPMDMRELRTHLGHVNPRHTVSAPLTLLHVVLAGLTNTPEFVPRWSPTPDEVRRAEDLIETLGLRDRAHARWAVLSHGERGRGLIARALIGQPHLLILDEPATGLDLAAREQLLAAMDELRRTDRQLASVLVTHHIEEIPASTTHALLLRDGRIVAQGPAHRVIDSDNITRCFAHPITITASNGRWSARAAARDFERDRASRARCAGRAPSPGRR